MRIKSEKRVFELETHMANNCIGAAKSFNLLDIKDRHSGCAFYGELEADGRL
jgi:hypothetical protein